MYCERAGVWEQTKTITQYLLFLHSVALARVLALAAGQLFFVPGHLFFHKNVTSGVIASSLVVLTVGNRGDEPEPGLSSATCFDGLRVVGWCGVMNRFLFWLHPKRSSVKTCFQM